jgi:hypothetical protein
VPHHRYSTSILSTVCYLSRGLSLHLCHILFIEPAESTNSLATSPCTFLGILLLSASTLYTTLKTYRLHFPHMQPSLAIFTTSSVKYTAHGLEAHHINNTLLQDPTAYMNHPRASHYIAYKPSYQTHYKHTTNTLQTHYKHTTNTLQTPRLHI